MECIYTHRPVLSMCRSHVVRSCIKNGLVLAVKPPAVIEAGPGLMRNR